MSSPTVLLIATDGFSPNAAPTSLPCLHYAGDESVGAPEEIEGRFVSAGWEPAWRFPMYKRSHYHSTCHEVLGIYRGRARLLIGGEKGKGREIDVKAGDTLVLPAGYSHRALSDSDGFSMVGAYPSNRSADWDMCYDGAVCCTTAIAKIQSWFRGIDGIGDPATGRSASEASPLREIWGRHQ